MTGRGWVAALGFAWACAPTPRAPAVSTQPLQAADLLTVDLDFVIRVDTERLRASEAFTGLFDRLSRHEASGLFRSLRPRLERSRAVLFGGRILADGFHGDGILIVEGGPDDPAPDPGFLPMLDQPPSAHDFASPRRGVRLFERTGGSRADAVLEAHLMTGGVALATAAEADAVLRIARDGPDKGRLEPRAHGVLSFAGRAFASSAADAQEKDLWRKLARGLRHYEGSVELIDGIEAEVDLEYDSAADATEAAAWSGTLVARLGLGEKPLRTLADSVHLSPRDENLGIRFKVPLDLLGALDWSKLASTRIDDEIPSAAKP